MTTPSDRYGELLAAFRAELPDAALTTPEKALRDMAAALALKAESQRDAILTGVEVSAERVAEVANAFCAAVESLGLT
jgi:hypothetical protein